MLSSRQRQPHPQGEDHQQVVRAREAAEALFSSKPSADPPSVAEPAAAAIRKPRVLQIIAPAPAERNDMPQTPPVASAPPVPEIPRSEFARIRTWVKYGMTVPQVAKLFGADVDEIRRILREI